MPMDLAANIANVRSRIKDAARKSGRQAEEIMLIAVTKTHPVEMMRQAVDLGLTAIGENRVQEAWTKAASLDRQVQWHLIGHLQTNKVNRAVRLFDLIHSIDSEKVALAVNHAAAVLGKVQDVLVQVNVAGEETKFGVTVAEAKQLVRRLSNLPNLRVCGLMTIAPYYSDPEQTRPVFRTLHRLFYELREENISHTNFTWLSMGMSNDYTVAVEEGANMVRIGSAIFGARAYGQETAH